MYLHKLTVFLWSSHVVGYTENLRMNISPINFLSSPGLIKMLILSIRDRMSGWVGLLPSSVPTVTNSKKGQETEVWVPSTLAGLPEILWTTVDTHRKLWGLGRQLKCQRTWGIWRHCHFLAYLKCISYFQGIVWLYISQYILSKLLVPGKKSTWIDKFGKYNISGFWGGWQGGGGVRRRREFYNAYQHIQKVWEVFNKTIKLILFNPGFFKLIWPSYFLKYSTN